jgi:hypothetical protein
MSGGPRASVPGQEQAAPPYRLLWLAGTLAIVVSAAAFVLWVVNGAGTLLDMIVALCT